VLGTPANAREPSLARDDIGRGSPRHMGRSAMIASQVEAT
jgi:hypothetical protein